MKYIIISIWMTLLLFSCSHDEPSIIDGSYNIISVSLTDCGDQGDRLSLGLGSEYCITAGDIEYCHEGSFTLANNDFSASFEINFQNESIVIESVGSYSFDGDFIEVTTNAGSITSSVNPANTQMDLLSVNFMDEESGCSVRFVGRKI